MPNILITGASQGIGEALALRYAACGAHLILIARNIEKLSAVAIACEKLGATTVYASIDIQNRETLEKFILNQDQSTPIELIIANAGIASTLKPNWQAEDINDIKAQVEVNILGTINTLDPLIKKMIARRSGQIAIMSSLAGIRGLPQSPSYCLSKGALRIYAQSLRSWLKRYNIKVNVICPGYVATEMSSQLSGPKPWLISKELAAKIIVKGLKRNQACIAFPWQLYWLTKLTNHLPANLVDKILNKFESYQIRTLQ